MTTKEGNSLSTLRKSSLSSPHQSPREASECGQQFGFRDEDVTGLQQVFTSSSSSSSSLWASLPSHTALSCCLSGSQIHKSRDQRHGPNLSFLPPLDKKGCLCCCKMPTYTAVWGNTERLLAPSTQPCRWGHKHTHTHPSVKLLLLLI